MSLQSVYLLPAVTGACAAGWTLVDQRKSSTNSKSLVGGRCPAIGDPSDFASSVCEIGEIVDGSILGWSLPYSCRPLYLICGECNDGAEVGCCIAVLKGRQSIS